MIPVIETFEMDPNDVLDYEIDWSETPAGANDTDLAVLESGETITASDWEVPDGITGSDDDYNDTETIIWLSAPAEKITYTITNEITTSLGRHYSRSIAVVVRDL